jgi:uncharacterized membrane protein YjjB (DUF3815 family)
MDWLNFFEKGIWFGFAGVGFAILFNVPPRTLIMVWLLAAIGGLTKLLMMHFGVGVVVASLTGSSVIGLLSIQTAHNKHAPPLVFAIPAVIPMVPGVFAYKMMIGLLRLSGETVDASYTQILSETISNGLKALFILMSLAVGVAIPMLITRKSSVKHIKVIKRKKVQK